PKPSRTKVGPVLLWGRGEASELTTRQYARQRPTRSSAFGRHSLQREGDIAIEIDGRSTSEDCLPFASDLIGDDTGAPTRASSMTAIGTNLPRRRSSATLSLGDFLERVVANVTSPMYWPRVDG